MPRTFISFLGAIEYYSTRYYQKVDKSDLSTPIYYVQEAILASEGPPWGEADQIWIFTTKDAETNNYHNRIFSKNELAKNEGLESRLNVLRNIGRIFHFEPVRIPNGHSQPEIWEIFETVFGKLRPNDEVVFDITFGFRSLPMLALVLLNYAQTIKNIQVKGIYYGNFEAGKAAHHEMLKLMELKGVSEDEMSLWKNKSIETPILNLAPFSELQDWTHAAQSFLFAGNAEHLAKLTENSHPEFSRRLLDFTDGILTSRGYDLTMTQDINRLKEMISDLGRLSGLQAQLKPLLSQVEQKIAPFHSRSLQNGFAAVQWCIDQGLIQQGITFLQEALISLVVEKVMGLSEINNYLWRTAAKGALDGVDNPKKTIHEKKRYQPDLPDETVKEKYEKMHQWVKSYPGLSDEYKKLTGSVGFRNDISHCGFRENPLKAEDLKRELRDLFESIKSLKLYAPQPLQPPLC